MTQTTQTWFLALLLTLSLPLLAAGTPTVAPGRYTAMLTATGTSSALPSGTGYATLRVGKGGGVAVAGRLPDGESFSQSTLVLTGTAKSVIPLDKVLTYPAVTIRGARGLLSGTLTYVPGDGSCNLYGTLQWTKPQQTRGDYPAAIDTPVHVSGSFYAPPTRDAGVLPGFTTGTLELSDTGAALLDKDVTLTPRNTLTITNPGPDKLKATLNRSTGVFKGTFRYPASEKPTDFQGVLNQDETIGGGFFLGPDGSGTVTLSP
jgi:hypothetical protein